MELRRVSVVAAVDTRYEAVEQQQRSPGGTHQAPARHRRTQPEKRRRTAPLPKQVKQVKQVKQDNRPPERARPTRPTRKAARHLVLPVPPSDAEKFSYVRRHTWVLTVFSILTFPPLIYGQVRLVPESPWFLLYVPFIALGLLTFLMSLFADGFSKGFDLAEHRRIVQSWAPRRYPSVDVFLPVCGEPIEILRNTWTHVAALRTAYPGTLTPYVLDDSGNPELKAMAKKFGFGYAARPNRGWYKKSGNLKYGFEISSGEFILLLDADFAPRADMLDETLPYFYAFPEVGIVQTPQYYRVVDEQTWVERGAGPPRSCSTGRFRPRGRAVTARSASGAAGSTAGWRWPRTAASRWPSTPRTCTPGSTSTGSAGGCATCRSCCPPGTARTT